MALLNYLEVGIRIVYLDASMSKEPYKVILPESFKETDIVGEVLYRPGHYDVLYKWSLLFYSKLYIIQIYQAGERPN